MSPLSFGLLIVAGGLGASLRYASTILITTKKMSFPLAIFISNVLGSFIAGAAAALLARELLSEDLAFVLIAGFCGGLTTMSTFAADSIELMTAGKWKTAGINIIGSTVTSIAAIALGLFLVGITFH